MKNLMDCIAIYLSQDFSRHEQTHPHPHPHQQQQQQHLIIHTNIAFLGSFLKHTKGRKQSPINKDATEVSQCDAHSDGQLVNMYQT